MSPRTCHRLLCVLSLASSLAGLPAAHAEPPAPAAESAPASPPATAQESVPAPAPGPAAGTDSAPASTTGTAPAQTPGVAAPPVAPPVLRVPIVPVYRLPPPRLQPLQVREAPRPPRVYGNAGAPFAVGLGGAIHFRREAGYRALGANKRQGALDLFASYDVFQPVRPLVIAAGINYRYEYAGDDQTVELTQHTVHAELSLRYTLTRWLFPYLRGGIGLNAASVRLVDDAGGFNAEDRATSISGALGGGFNLRTPARAMETRRGHLSSLSFGLLIEGGYLLTPAAAFKLEPKRDSDIAQERIDLGKIARSGAYLRILAVARF